MSPNRSAGRLHGSAGAILGALFLIAVANACVVYHTGDRAVDASRATTIRSPTRAHLADGSTVLYRSGVTIEGDTLRGHGERYGLRLEAKGAATAVPLDSVVAMETVTGGVDVPLTVLGSAATAGVGVLAATALAVAIFGSCPTFYSADADGWALEAEGFPYSIAPLFEARTVHRLAARSADGGFGLDVRNEALETHYLNHLELLEVAHAPEEYVVPDVQGHPIVVNGLRPPASATDRSRREVTAVLATADGLAFRTDARRLTSVAEDDLEDHLDLTFPRPAGADSVVLVLRARNSLLTTVLLYDVMLDGQGARALDWVGQDLQRIGTAVELGRWYRSRMGLRVESQTGTGGPVPAAWIRDVGPIAWKDVAVIIAAPPGDSVRVRLSFVADNWRIDRVALAGSYTRPAARSHRLARVLDADGRPDSEARRALDAPDDGYLVTRPGERFRIEFDTGAATDDSTRTFLLAAQGYYIEWLRADWIRDAAVDTSFIPSDAAVLRALRSWEARRAELEMTFFENRIPVR